MLTTVSVAPFGLRERNKLEKRHRIRQATDELFSAQGFEATTLRQIAERARVGLGTLFHYAQDKRDHTFLLFNDDLAQLVDEAIAASARETRILEQIVAIWEPHYQDLRCAEARPSPRKVEWLLVAPVERGADQYLRPACTVTLDWALHA